MKPVAVASPPTTLPALDLLKLMFLAREGDRREGILLRQSKGWFQVSAMGHEQLAAINYHLVPEDYLYLYYRDRALALARGITNYDLALAYLAKAESNSAGRMMPGHFSSRKHNVFSVATPTGSQCIPACGSAWGFKLGGMPYVSIATIGDAAARQGEFFEAVALALQEQLPVVFIVEDNAYGISTPTGKFTPYRIGALSESHMVRVDARDPYAMFERSSEAVRKARAGDGPTVLWCEIDRLCSHTSSDDHRVYRAADEIAAMACRDPIDVLSARLIREGLLTKEEWSEYQRDIVEQVAADYRDAEAAAEPDASHIMEHLYGPAAVATPPPLSSGESTTMVTAVNHSLLAALRTDDKIIVFGEDIEDPKGGVFGITKGLSAEFPERAFNSPLAEATIIGTAVGLAATGYKPVFEIQFIDFITPGLNQLMSQVSTLRWRTDGEWACPMVLMAPYGAYLPGGGVWHSQSNEGLFAHMHGIHIVIPSTPEDAAGLLWTVIHGSDPTLFLLPKHIFRKRVTVEGDYPAVPLGKAAIRREGSDITLVSWGNCLEICAEAADEAHADGLSVEILDLRTIVPCDWEAIEQSLSKTGRLVVVHEDSRTGGFGQAIITEMTSHPQRWNMFLSPPQLVARMDIHIPYNPILEYAVLPGLQQVLDAIRIAME